MSRGFRELIEKKWAEDKFVCIGLDPVVDRLPEPFRLRRTEYSQTTPCGQFVHFVRSILDATKDIVHSYKINPSFYLKYGSEGLSTVRQIIDDIHSLAPDVPVILDGKYGGAIREENLGYAECAFDFLGADAVTVHAYPGREAMQPFLDYKEKGIFIVCRTSGAGSGEFQQMDVAGDSVPGSYMPLYEYVAHCVANDWNENGNCGVVVGANHPEELKEVRGRVLDMPILCPAVGPQQEHVSLDEQVRWIVSAGKYGRDLPLILSSSRGIIFAKDPRAETLRLIDLVNQYR